MAGDQGRGLEDAVRGPAVAMKDAHAISNHAGRRVDDHFARKVGYEADVMIAEDQLYRQPRREDRSEKLEQHRSQGSRDAHNRMLHVARDHDPGRSPRGRSREEFVRKTACRAFRQTFGSRFSGAEAQVKVGDDKEPFFSPSLRGDHERRTTSKRS